MNIKQYCLGDMQEGVWGQYEPPFGVWGEAPAAKRFPGHIGAHASAGGSIFRRPD